MDAFERYVTQELRLRIVLADAGVEASAGADGSVEAEGTSESEGIPAGAAASAGTDALVLFVTREALAAGTWAA
ncbi:hypothetical protein, partial [Paenibacillus validus]|nr:hypothetical protein [Paenibacillus validus]